MGQRYRSPAVVPDGTPEPAYTRDPELYYHPTTWPGARLPHAWLGHEAEKVSTQDLAGHGRFALLTGVSGRAWEPAAAAASKELGTEVASYVIGPNREYFDVYDDWARAREVREDGCVLVRPDGYVAWRANAMPDDPSKILTGVLSKILDRA